MWYLNCLLQRGGKRKLSSETKLGGRELEILFRNASLTPKSRSACDNVAKNSKKSGNRSETDRVKCSSSNHMHCFCGAIGAGTRSRRS
jgi:hypothetical protein